MLDRRIHQQMYIHTRIYLSCGPWVARRPSGRLQLLDTVHALQMLLTCVMLSCK